MFCTISETEAEVGAVHVKDSGGGWGGRVGGGGGGVRVDVNREVKFL